MSKSCRYCGEEIDSWVEHAEEFGDTMYAAKCGGCGYTNRRVLNDQKI